MQLPLPLPLRLPLPLPLRLPLLLPPIIIRRRRTRRKIAIKNE